MLELLVAAATRPVPPVSSLRPDLLPEIAAIVDKALSFQKANRYLTAAEMQAAVRAARR